MKKLFLFCLIIPLLLLGCSTTETETGLDRYYTSFDIAGLLPEDCFLQEGEDPQIIVSDDLESDMYALQAERYVAIGMAAYYGERDSLYGSIEAFCRKKGAVKAIYSQMYSDSKETTVSSTSSNTYFFPYINTASTYSYTSYYTFEIDYYDHILILFARLSEELAALYEFPGIICIDLDNNMKLDAKQNTGAYVSVVFNDTAAAKANIFKGDVITQVNSQPVMGADDYYSKISTLLERGESMVDLTYWRNGEKETVSLSLRSASSFEDSPTSPVSRTRESFGKLR